MSMYNDDDSTLQTSAASQPPTQFADDTSGENDAAPAPVQGPSEGEQTQAAPTTEAPASPYAPHMMLRSGAQKIVSYLMGAGAADPRAAKSAAVAVDPRGGMSEDDRNLLAVHQAGETGGPEAAWAMVQANRVAYNAKQSFAKAALNGIDGKPPDPLAAADAATKAGSHLLDGSSVSFRPTEDGNFHTTLHIPGVVGPRHMMLTSAQFNQWLDASNSSQFDKVIESGGAPAVLQKIAAGPGEPVQGQGGDPRLKGSRNGIDLSGQPSNVQTGPSAQDTGYGNELEARAQRIFPWASQEAQRQQWMAAQEEKELERSNKIDVASEQGKRRLDVARATGQSRVEAADKVSQGRTESQKIRTGGNIDVANINAAGRQKSTDAKLKMAADAVASKRLNAEQEQRMRNFRAELQAQPFGDTAALERKWGVDKMLQQSGVAPPQQVPTQQQAQPQPEPQQPQPAPKPAAATGALQGPNGEPAIKIGAHIYYKGPDGKAVLLQ